MLALEADPPDEGYLALGPRTIPHSDICEGLHEPAQHQNAIPSPVQPDLKPVPSVSIRLDEEQQQENSFERPPRGVGGSVAVG